MHRPTPITSGQAKPPPLLADSSGGSRPLATPGEPTDGAPELEAAPPFPGWDRYPFTLLTATPSADASALRPIAFGRRRRQGGANHRVTGDRHPIAPIGRAWAAPPDECQRSRRGPSTRRRGVRRSAPTRGCTSGLSSGDWRRR